MNVECWWGDSDRENLKYLGEYLPCDTLYTPCFTLSGLGYQ